MIKIVKIGEKRKNKPSIAEIEKLMKEDDVIIYNAPFEFANKLIGHFKNWEWRIYRNLSDEVPFCRFTYWENYDIIEQNIRNGKVYKIFIYKRDLNGFKYAEVFLRNEKIKL